MSLHEVMEKLSGQAQGAVLGLWTRWQEGDVSEAQFRALATATLAQYGAKGAAVADVALAASLTMLTGSVAVTTGDMEDPADGATEAVDDALDSEGYQRDPSNAMAVMGGAYTLGKMQDAYSKGMQNQGVELWVRAPNDGACDMCMDLADAYLPASVDMYHHKGCGCIQQPVQMKE